MTILVANLRLHSSVERHVVWQLTNKRLKLHKGMPWYIYREVGCQINVMLNVGECRTLEKGQSQ